MKKNCTQNRAGYGLLTVMACFTFLLSFSQTQTQVVRIPNPAIHPGITGYLESLPVDYDSNSTKKYPLIIFWHGAGETGDATGNNVNAVAANGLPQYIKDGLFPSSFTVANDTFSFIVLSPQIKNAGTSSLILGPTMLQYAIDNYLVDTTRVYFTGLSLGGRISWAAISGSETTTRKIAAEVLVCPGSVEDPLNGTGAVAIPAASNMPVWTISNGRDPKIPLSVLSTLTDNFNAYIPTPSPLAKLDTFNAYGHDAWTRGYNPDTRIDSLNIYEWMLQYTNNRLTAKAGPDQAFATVPSSITLNGSASHARGGRIVSYNWTKISGPDGGIISNPADSITTAISLNQGTYQYKLTVTHTDNSTASDTVSIVIDPQATQYLRKVTTPISAYCGGYLESLPVDYFANPTKKYPVIISLHTNEEFGDGSQTALDTLKHKGIPKYIHDGTFPASFTVNGQQYSFIVIAPQLVNADITSAQSVLNYVKANYRVDTSRIYLTGLRVGGRVAWRAPTTSASFTGSIAALTLIAPNSIIGFVSDVDIPAASSLPLWVLQNQDDPAASVARVDSLVNYYYNQYSPAPSPLARLTVFTGSEQPANKLDAWTRTFDPNFKEDSLNIYEWMLQYTNNRLTAKAGPDQAFATVPSSITLNGSASHARGGRIVSYNWTKISGPDGGIISNPADSITTAISLNQGTYQYKLTVTHTDNSTASDTVSIVIDPQATQYLRKVTTPISAYCGGYLESLPVDYFANPTKKYPVIISLHTNEEFGDGSQTALDTLKHKGIPKYIHDGTFPTSFTVNGQQYSFIVIAPQLVNADITSAQSVLNYVKANYRVDTSRIYLTGLRVGGRVAWRATTTSASFTGSIAALTLIAPNSIIGFVSDVDIPAASSLPLWVLQNQNDPAAPVARVDSLVNYYYNQYSPAPSPLARLTVFTGSEQPANKLDAWTRTFDPNFKEDSLNIYEWMLQYTNNRTVNDTTDEESRRVANPENTLQANTNSSQTTGRFALTLNPNPVTTTLNISLLGSVGGKVTAAIINNQGRYLLLQRFDKAANSNSNQSINVSHLPAGIYYLQVIIDGKNMQRIKFVKQ